MWRSSLMQWSLRLGCCSGAGSASSSSSGGRLMAQRLSSIRKFGNYSFRTKFHPFSNRIEYDILYCDDITTQSSSSSSTNEEGPGGVDENEENNDDNDGDGGNYPNTTTKHIDKGEKKNIKKGVKVEVVKGLERQPLKCDLLVIPIWHDPDRASFDNQENSGISTSSSISNHYAFHKLDMNHKLILSKVMKENCFDPKKSGQYIVTRIFGDDMTFNFPKKIALVAMGQHPLRNNSSHSSSSSSSSSSSPQQSSQQKPCGNRLIPSKIEQSRILGSTIEKIICQYKAIKSVHVWLPVDEKTSKTDNAELALHTKSLIESLNLACFRDTRFKNINENDNNNTESDDCEDSSPNAETIPRDVRIIVDESQKKHKNKYDACIEFAQSITDGIVFARELVNTPANLLNPQTLGLSASSLSSHELSVKVFSEEECEKFGMTSFLSVGKASENDSQFIHLKLPIPCLSGKKQKKTAENIKKIVLIGKGVTFDSGGYNLKTGAGSSIDKMKYDMAGGAAVLGTFAALRRIFPYIAQSDCCFDKNAKEGCDKVQYELHGCIAACENLISGNSQVNRPGDIVIAADGTTIEVNNTDAEGRLTLADAIWYAKNVIGADVIVDLATLTGAVKIALGPQIGGLFSTSDALANELLKCSYESGEPLWRLPLYSAYKDMLKSDIADIKNSSTTGFAGSIVGGLFLQKFVENKCTLNEHKNKKCPEWAHIDLAGPVWSDTKLPELNAGGATGYGVRLLSKYIMSQCGISCLH